MRHKNKGRYLNIKRNHYHSMMNNLCNSLIKHERIITTTEKAKELRSKIEKIINKSKINNLHNKRKIFSIIRNKNNVYKLFNNISKRYLNRNGGYTKIIKYYKYRKGDNADMSYIILIN